MFHVKLTLFCMKAGAHINFVDFGKKYYHEAKYDPVYLFLHYHEHFILNSTVELFFRY